MDVSREVIGIGENWILGGEDLLTLSSLLRPGPVLQEAKATPILPSLCVSISKALVKQMSKM